ncbi:iron-containing alcohol dehydrogenase [Pseudomonas protegens]|jgi:alcohol dehydrogenase class IV|uniref:Alcohol dehydrogenase, iron-dependent family n=4 Tax=Pseudomonas TaxID=286 RepID=Q4K4Z2_PSEF5|nr:MULTISPECIES: iron-containing alcohol dehydrogenase [Pseudomonas]BCQ65277.1 alcohol dehydrogenase [Pseudomonas sp. Boi14]AAY94825.1 alcohol dehydrogenase, iron-dependent family [Pseudomonas protegens Pf-5]AGL87314.1 1,3-propanediol dehydrogenase DhaT [Pseudomonas protegens CHA0]ASE21021.1 NAD-dependent alcohol dehydrogenase [Pseudomonas protegens]MBB1616821.1 alcohol dehydrogenase [Pseudomonas sp. UMC65]
MSISSFKIAHKLLTGSTAIEQLAAELTRLDVDNPLIVTDTALLRSGTVELALAHLGERSYEVFDRVQPDPEIAIVEDCMQVYREGGHDGLIGLGGGSAIDIAKSVGAYAGYHGALEDLFGIDQVPRKGPPLIAIPTTAGTGSEVTNVAILSDRVAQLKKGIISDYLLPDVALVSPQMTLTCPPRVTAASGVDALAHAIEAYLSLNASAITDSLAIGAIKLIVKALPKAFANPAHLQAREDMATASLMAGMAFGNAGVGAVHAMAYPLGGRFHMSHGVSNALLLPYVMTWNKMACVERMQDIAEAMGVQTAHLSASEAADRAVEAMAALCAAVEIPSGLRSFGVPEDAIPAMAVEAAGIERLMRNNPRRLSPADIEKIYRAAY